MISLVKRGMKVYFKDKGAVFFSLLGVLIIFALFIFFLGDGLVKNVTGAIGITKKSAEIIMGNWVIAGMIASASITSSMGAYALMVTDRQDKLIKDIQTTPLSRASIAGGYMITGYIVSVIMSVITLILGQFYVLAKGGVVFEPMVMIKSLAVILLASFASSALICFIISFVKSSNAYTTISILLGTLIGFLVGAYIDIGSLPSGVRWVIKCFPSAHAAVAFRQILMKSSMAKYFANMPSELVQGFKENVGVVFKYNSHEASMWVHLLVLAATGVIFYALSILNMRRKVD